MKEIFSDLVKDFKEHKFDVIAHGCNCHNRMGAGIVKTIKNAYPEVFIVDRDFNVPKGRQRLGKLSIYHRSVSNQYIVNCYTQDTIGIKGVIDVPFEIDKFEECLQKLYDIKNYPTLTPPIRLGLPYIGGGLGGGDRKAIRALIEKYAKANQELFETTLVDFKK